MTVQAPASTDITVPQPPPRDQSDADALYRHLAQFTKSGQFNATLQRQERAALLAIYGKAALSQTAIPSDATVIANPPTQANVQALQATINKLVTQVNALSLVVGPLLDAVNANLKSLPATAT